MRAMRWISGSTQMSSQVRTACRRASTGSEIPAAAEGVRSYAPALPFGAHRRPMNVGADLSPQGIAALMLDFIAALGLSDVTIVGNDTGGAICQVMLGADTSRIGAAVLTNCDAFGTFPPRAFVPLFRALRHPGLVACLVPGLRSERCGTARSPTGRSPAAPSTGR